MAGDRGDFVDMRALLDERIVTHSPGGTERVGFEALRRSWAAAHEGLGDLRHDVQDVLVTGASAASRIVVTGVHSGPLLGVAGTWAVLRVEQALSVRVTSGRIAEILEVVDTGAGLRQLGVLGDQPLTPGEWSAPLLLWSEQERSLLRRHRAKSSCGRGV
jgi:predicted ester cyclase